MEALRTDLANLYNRALEVMPGKGDEAMLAFTAVLCRTQFGRLRFCTVVLAPMKLSCATVVVGKAAPPFVIEHSLKVVVAG